MVTVEKPPRRITLTGLMIYKSSRDLHELAAVGDRLTHHITDNRIPQILCYRR
jgi:hypothetical protein